MKGYKTGYLIRSINIEVLLSCEPFDLVNILGPDGLDQSLQDMSGSSRHVVARSSANLTSVTRPLIFHHSSHSDAGFPLTFSSSMKEQRKQADFSSSEQQHEGADFSSSEQQHEGAEETSRLQLI